MKRFRLLICVGIILGLTAALFITGPAAAEDTVKIGVVYALTGKGSALGVKQMDSAKLAIKEINKTKAV
ncbi:MAG: ABC transporter substrate-binding protein [Desulfobacteraceae bacterium]|nr:ABC transporter substrate-binding protein [Desulfobacteraceae bacterium]